MKTGNKNGMNWIRQERRLAIYLRDGLACVYCGDSVEKGATLTLDHIRPRSKGGSNQNENLVTCCCRCNSSRGNRSLRGFCKAVGHYQSRSAVEIERFVHNVSRRVVDVKAAKALIAQRGSAAKVLNQTEEN